MTARQVYEAVLIEMNKVQAPSLLLEDFNYLFNKAINQYINKKYNIYDINQQSTDDLRVLKSSVTLRAINEKSPVNDVTVRDSMYGAIYEFALPADYLHLLNCVCNFKVNKPFKCYNANTYVQFPAERLTSDLWSQIINNFYMRPSYKRPYYFIHNVNSYPADSTWQTGNYTNDNSPQNKYGNKINYEGNFGRVPSENIYLPTDGGNTDIQHLVPLNGVFDRFGQKYTDDNNHYDDDRKYGIPRFLDFSEPEISNGNFLWRRTGKGILFANVDITGDGKKEKVILGDLNFKPKQYVVDVVDANNEAHSRGDFYRYNGTVDEGGLYSDMATSVKVTINNSVVKHIGNNLITFIDGGANQQYAEQDDQDVETTLQYVVNGENVTVGVQGTPIQIEWEWVPLLKHTKYNSVEKVGEVRYGNPSTVRLEIRYGKDNSLFTLDSVYVDYIKSPQYIRITQEQLDLTEDTSQIMEFPDYVIQEIINELVHIVMENSGDARLQTHIPISQSIATPTQQQEAPQASARRRS